MLRNRFSRSYWYRNVANVALVLLEHTWTYAILKLHLQLFKLHLNILKLHWFFWKNIEHLFLIFFYIFRIFQKVLPRIPGGCRHQESAGHLVLDKCYRRFRDTCFDIFEILFWKNKLFQLVQKSFLKWHYRDKIRN